MTQHPDDRLAGPDHSEIETTAQLFKDTFDLASQVAAQVTPEDTERALADILRRVQMADNDAEDNSGSSGSDSVPDYLSEITDPPAMLETGSAGFTGLALPTNAGLALPMDVDGELCSAYLRLERVRAEITSLEGWAAQLEVEGHAYLARVLGQGEMIRKEAAARAEAYEARSREAADRYRDNVFDKVAALVKETEARKQEVEAREQAVEKLRESLEPTSMPVPAWVQMFEVKNTESTDVDQRSFAAAIDQGSFAAIGSVPILDIGYDPVLAVDHDSTPAAGLYVALHNVMLKVFDSLDDMAEQGQWLPMASAERADWRGDDVVKMLGTLGDVVDPATEKLSPEGRARAVQISIRGGLVEDAPDNPVRGPRVRFRSVLLDRFGSPVERLTGGPKIGGGAYRRREDRPKLPDVSKAVPVMTNKLQGSTLASLDVVVQSASGLAELADALAQLTEGCTAALPVRDPAAIGRILSGRQAATNLASRVSSASNDTREENEALDVPF
jgi:hypothetical protein